MERNAQNNCSLLALLFICLRFCLFYFGYLQHNACRYDLCLSTRERERAESATDSKQYEFSHNCITIEKQTGWIELRNPRQWHEAKILHRFERLIKFYIEHITYLLMLMVVAGQFSLILECSAYVHFVHKNLYAFSPIGIGKEESARWLLFPFVWQAAAKMIESDYDCIEIQTERTIKPLACTLKAWNMYSSFGFSFLLFSILFFVSLSCVCVCLALNSIFIHFSLFQHFYSPLFSLVCCFPSTSSKKQTYKKT